MLVHSLASKYARFVVLVRQMYWTPPFRSLDPPLLKSDDLFFREPIDIGPPPFKNPGHAPDLFLFTLRKEIYETVIFLAIPSLIHQSMARICIDREIFFHIDHAYCSRIYQPMKLE